MAGNHRIVTFLDDNPACGGDPGSVAVVPQVVTEMKSSIDQVRMAIPSLPRSERRRIVDSFQRLGIPMLQVPSVDDLTSGRARVIP